MIRATEIFVPSSFPTATYVEREDERLEKKFRDAIETPKSPISISGPSKTGKTALVRKIVGEDNLIHIFGTQIESPSDIWEAILNWMATPTSVQSQTGRTETVAPSLNAATKMAVPGLSVTLGGGLSTTTAANSNSTATQQNRGMPAVCREIGNSDFIVFLDDFHYIKRDLQEAVVSK